MWLKLAIGAVVGLILGYFLAPGMAFWVVLGIVAGYVTEVWLGKRKESRENQEASS